jgi:hypothetical protein
MSMLDGVIRATTTRGIAATIGRASTTRAAVMNAIPVTG